MLRWRLISAAVIIGGMVALVVLDYRQAIFHVPGVWLLPVLLAIVLMGTEEVLSFFQAQQQRPVGWVIYLGNLLIGLAACGPLWWNLAGHDFPEANPLGRFGWPLAALALASILVLTVEIQQFTRPGEATVSAALGIFAFVYIGVLASLVAMLRLLPTGPQGNEWGILAIVSVILVTKLADTGAYFFGRALGRHKMTPLLSPGKTWEGAAGGLLTACAGSWAWFHFGGPWLIGPAYVEPTLVASLAYGLILAIAGMIGDLAESMLKRDSQRKDSSTWLPGLGGVLDIIDSILVAGPCAYLCWLFGLVGPGA